VVSMARYQSLWGDLIEVCHWVGATKSNKQVSGKNTERLHGLQHQAHVRNRRGRKGRLEGGKNPHCLRPWGQKVQVDDTHQQKEREIKRGTSLAKNLENRGKNTTSPKERTGGRKAMLLTKGPRFNLTKGRDWITLSPGRKYKEKKHR